MPPSRSQHQTTRRSILNNADAPRWVSVATLAFLVVAVAFAFDDLLRDDRLPFYRDLLAFVLPLKHFLGESLREGVFPLWNPWIFMGTPFLASLQTGVLYPPSVLLILPFPLGFNLFAFAHYLIALAGAWSFFRSRELSPVASAIGAVTFVVGGYLVSVLNLTSHLQAAAWLPWLLWSWQRFVDSRSSLRLAGFAVLLAVEILAGAPEIFLMSLALLGAWTVCLQARDRVDTLRLGLGLGASLALAACLSAAQILPTAELLAESNRRNFLPYGEVSAWALQPISLLQLVIPHSAGIAAHGSLHPFLESGLAWLSSIYIGLVPLCLMCAGLVTGRGRFFWGAAIVLATLLALGDHTPLFRVLYEEAPGLFGKFRYPEKFLFVAHAAAAVMAAEGAERILRDDRRALRIAVTAAATLFGVALLGLGIRWLDPSGFVWLLGVLKAGNLMSGELAPLAFDVVFKLGRVVLFLGCFLTVCTLSARGRIGASPRSILLLVLVAADLVPTHHNLNLSIGWSQLVGGSELLDVESLRADRGLVFHYQTTSLPNERGERIPVAGLQEWQGVMNLGDLEGDVIAGWRSHRPNVGMVQKIRALGGLEGIQPASDHFLRAVLEVLPRDKAVGLLRLYGASYLVGQEPLDVAGLEPAGTTGASHPVSYAYRVSDPIPSAYLVSRLEHATSQLDAVNHLIRPSFQPRDRAVVEELPEGWRDGAVVNGGVKVVADESQGTLLRVKTETPAFLVLNESFFPGWICDVNGTATRIVRTNALVRGVAVPPGEHLVRFRYRPESFRRGAFLSSLGIAILAAWIGFSLARRRRA